MTKVGGQRISEVYLVEGKYRRSDGTREALNWHRINEMGGASSMQNIQKHTGFCWANLKEQDHLECSEVD